jgi:hypothetical protein
MMGNDFTPATGTANTAAASTIIVGTAIADAITVNMIGTAIATSQYQPVLRPNPEQLGGIPAQDRAAVGIA